MALMTLRMSLCLTSVTTLNADVSWLIYTSKITVIVFAVKTWGHGHPIPASLAFADIPLKTHVAAKAIIHIFICSRRESGHEN